MYRRSIVCGRSTVGGRCTVGGRSTIGGREHYWWKASDTGLKKRLLSTSRELRSRFIP